MMPQPDPRFLRIPGVHVGTTWGDCASPLAVNVADGDAHGLRLKANPLGPFRLNSQDGSLGRLRLPRNIAVDHAHRVYLLDQRNKRILRCEPDFGCGDPSARAFHTIPVFNRGNNPDDPRTVRTPKHLVVVGGQLVVSDGTRLLMFQLDTWALTDVHTLPTEMVDLAAYRGVLYALTVDAIYRLTPGDLEPELFFQGDDSTGPWSGLAVDRQERLYLLQERDGTASLLVYDPQRPTLRAVVTDAAHIRDRFAAPAVFTLPDEKRVRFVIPAVPKNGESNVQADFARIPQQALVVDELGQALDPKLDPPPRVRFFDSGKAKPPSTLAPAWISRRIDSGLFRCVWDAITVEFTELPPGGKGEISLYTSDLDETDRDILNLPDNAWSDSMILCGRAQSRATPERVTEDCFVNAPPGRYLWVRIRLFGDGFSSPVLHHLEFRFPRRSWLEHLPAVFSEDDAGRRFLEQFLGVFQFEWDKIEGKLETIEMLFDPQAAPADMLDSWAKLFGIHYPPHASEEVRRDYLAGVGQMMFAPRAEDGRPGGTCRGTVQSLRNFIAAGFPVQATNSDEPGFPIIIEGFRERNFVRLHGDNASQAGGSTLPIQDDEGATSFAPSLWSPEFLGRFQLGVSSRLDENLLYPDIPQNLESFHATAHRFRVVLPAAWISSPGEERALRAVIESEKPAHTDYELQLVRPGVCVGLQSTLGVDTILGGDQVPLGTGGPRLGIDPLPPAPVTAPLPRLDASVQIVKDHTRI